MPDNPSRIIAVTGKGGTGKTTFTAIATKILLAAGHHPLIIDADPPVSLALALGADSVRTVGEYRQRLIEDPTERQRMGDRHIREILMEEALADMDGFSFLAIGRSEGPGCFCGINELLKYGIESLSERFELTMIDCEAGIEQINRRVINHINTLLIISDATMKGIHAATHLKDIAGTHGVEGPVRIGLVFNRVDGDISHLIEKARDMGLEVIGVIPADAQVADFDARGEPTLRLPDNAESVVAVKGILESIGLLEAARVEGREKGS